MNPEIVDQAVRFYQEAMTRIMAELMGASWADHLAQCRDAKAAEQEEPEWFDTEVMEDDAASARKAAWMLVKELYGEPVAVQVDKRFNTE